MKPLYGALKGSPCPKTLDWTQELNKAFEEAKNALSQATLLHNPVPGAPIALTTDASDIAIGAVLEQQIHGRWQPLHTYPCLYLRTKKYARKSVFTTFYKY